MQKSNFPSTKGRTARVARLSLLLVCLFGLTVSLALAQNEANKGSIVGTVVDPNAALVPKAKVTANSPTTGLSRSVTTNDAGEFRFPALDPGVYQVKVEAAGFAVSTLENVTVGVGASITVTVGVAIQATTQTVEVGSSFVEVSESQATQNFNREAISDLPINGRRFQDFATLAPTVQANDSTRGQLSFAGQRGINSNIMVDGSDYNEPFFGGIRGGERSIFAFTVPQSSVQEFQTVIAGYTAEYGRSTGGILNAITRSGSNEFHGDGFWQYRSPDLGVSNPYFINPANASLGKQQSLEKQHQFGGGIGGPIVKNKLFFFAAGEAQLATFPRRVRFSALDSITNVTPDISPAFNYYRSLEGPFSQTNDATAILGRVDYNFTNGSRIAVRYNHSNNEAVNAASVGTSLVPETNSAISNNGTEKDNTNTAVGQYTAILSPALLNDFRIQYSREERPRTNNANAPTVSTSIGTFGSRSFLPTTASDSRFQAADSFTVQAGKHSLKFGVDASYLDIFQTFGFNQFGAYSVSGSNTATILRLLSRNNTTALPGNLLDDSSVTYSRQIGNLTLGANSTQLAFFAQDSWRATPKLTVNYGLRWEGQFNPQPATTNAFLMQQVQNFRFPYGSTNPAVIRDQLQQWAPRLGIAWDITGKGKTVLRAEGGIYYAQTPLIVYAGPLNNFRIPAGDLSLVITPSPGNTIYQQFKNIGVDLNTTTLDKLPLLTIAQVQQIAGPSRNPYFGAAPITTSGDKYRNPKSYQFSGGLTHELVRGLVLDYQLISVNTVNLERNLDLNLPRPFVKAGDLSQRLTFGLRSGTPRPNPNVGTVLIRDSSARSNYLGNTFRAQYRMRKLQFSAQYTLSFAKSDDDNERDASGFGFQNPFNLKDEYNYSNFDTRHQFTGYAVYRAPWGIEITGIVRARTGYPFTPITGGDTSELLGGSNRPLSAPGVFYKRNSFRNLDYKSVDLRVMKAFTFRDRYRAEFSAEMFNLFNFDNLAYTNQGYIYGIGIQTNGQAAPVDARFKQLVDPSTGKLNTNTSQQQGGPFQAQIGVRFIF